MKKHTLLLFFITTFSFSQTVVSEFPIEIKHKIGVNKSTGEKYVPHNTSSVLNQFKSKFYTLNSQENILLIKKFDQTYIHVLDSLMKETEGVAVIKKVKQKLLPFHVVKKENIISLYYKKTKKVLFSTKVEITCIHYNIDTKKYKTEKIKFNPKNERTFAIFFIDDDLQILTSTKFSNTINIYKHYDNSILKTAEHTLNELEYTSSYSGSKMTASAIFKKADSILPVLSKDNHENFSKTSLKNKIYITENREFTLTVDDNESTNKGTHIYTFNIDEASKKDYQFFNYQETVKELNYNSLLSNENLLQLGINANQMKLHILNFSTSKKTDYSFQKNDSLFRDSNTHYAVTGFFSGQQKERNEKSSSKFLKYTSKGDTGISCIKTNGKLHLLVGSKRVVTRSSGSGMGMPGAGGMGMPIGGFISSISTSFNNNAYLVLNNDHTIDHSLELKNSQFEKLKQFSDEHKNYKLEYQFTIDNKHYIGYYDSLNMLYKIVKL